MSDADFLPTKLIGIFTKGRKLWDMLHSEETVTQIKYPHIIFSHFFLLCHKKKPKHLQSERKGEVNLLRDSLMTAYCSILSTMAYLASHSVCLPSLLPI